MKKNKEYKSKLLYGVAAAFFAISLSAIFIFFVFRNGEIQKGFRTMTKIITPFLIGCVMAYVIRPVCDFLEEHLTAIAERDKQRPKLVRFMKGASVFLSMLFAFFIIYILSAMVFPKLLVSIMTITQRIPQYIKNLTMFGERIFAENAYASQWFSELSRNTFEKVQTWSRTDLIPQLGILVGGVSTGVKNIFSFMMNVVIGVIVCAYILSGRKKMGAQAKLVLYSLFHKKWAQRIENEVIFADKVFSGFISGKLVDSAIIGCVCFIVLSIMNTPYAMLVSVIVGVTNIIPFFGPYIGAVPSAFLILTVNPMQCLYFIIFIVILQQIDGNIIGPKILGNSTGLSSFWVLFAITIFGGIFGFPGMLVGVPVFAVIYDIIKQLINWGLKHHENEELLDTYEENFPDDRNQAR